MAKTSDKRGLQIAADREMAKASGKKVYDFPIRPPTLMPGVVPAGVDAPVLAADSATYTYAASGAVGGGFPGFPYLAQLATRAEYRAFAAALSTELTREWIKLTSKQDDATDTSEKIKKIERKFVELDLRNVIRQIAEHDALFGRGQMFVDVGDPNRELPLILDKRTIRKGALKRITAVDPVWTTPSGYDSIDPTAPDFYRPAKWFMLGKEVHASRLLTVVTRPLPDILKPAFNFAGMSLSQLAEPYVDNWLRTRQSVADLINNFSITALATAMDEVLNGDDDGAAVVARAQLFTATRSNRGLMLLDKDREELVQINTPLSGLHELQAQAQEQMCSVSHIPAIILIGVSPTGLNASSEGEIRSFYDWVAAQQEAHYRSLIETVLRIVQLSEFGEIDPDISFEFVPLYQLDATQEADIRLKDSQAATAYINAGVIDPQEERERLARDPKSGYLGLDTSVEIVPPTPPGFGETDPNDDPNAPPFAAKDGDWKEGDHPRAPDGKFGSGGGGGPKGNAPAGAAHVVKKFADIGAMTPAWGKTAKANAEIAARILNDAGINAMTENPSGRKTDGRFAAIGSPTNGVLINKSSPFWKDPAAMAKSNAESGHLASSSPMGVLLHEVGHTLHTKAPGYWPVPAQKELAGEVSRYAMTSPKEFVAEVFAGIHTGKEYSPEVMRQYSQWAEPPAQSSEPPAQSSEPPAQSSEPPESIKQRISNVTSTLKALGGKFLRYDLPIAERQKDIAKYQGGISVTKYGKGVGVLFGDAHSDPEFMAQAKSALADKGYKLEKVMPDNDKSDAYMVKRDKA
jgi:phage-related protein (TIGR01555 family)